MNRPSTVRHFHMVLRMTLKTILAFTTQFNYHCDCYYYYHFLLHHQNNDINNRTTLKTQIIYSLIVSYSKKKKKKKTHGGLIPIYQMLNNRCTPAALALKAGEICNSKSDFVSKVQTIPFRVRVAKGLHVITSDNGLSFVIPSAIACFSFLFLMEALAHTHTLSLSLSQQILASHSTH